MNRTIRALLLLLALGVHAGGVRADVFNPAYLQLAEIEPDTFEVVWRVPTRGAARLNVNIEFPPGVTRLTPARATLAGNYQIESWTISAPGGLAGKTLAFEGLLGGATDVIARITFLNGAEQVERLPPGSAAFTVAAPEGALAVASAYFVLGVEHILMGLDHLLFVLALLLIVRGWRQILATITAFTVAHSITLAAAALGWLVVPIAPVEAIIALSIVFVAAEALHARQGRPGLTARAPWIVAFSFGLLHGLGFASALSEIGLPEHAIPLALLTFNLGVEAGQVLFVAAVIALATALARFRLPLEQALVARVIPYAIGSLAAFWTIERVVTGVLGLNPAFGG